MLSSGKSWKGFWLELMGKSVKYPFEESEKGLDEATVTEQITAVIDSSFPAPSSISATAESEVIAAYFANLPAIYAKIERLIKMELITQFAHSLDTEEAQVQGRDHRQGRGPDHRQGQRTRQGQVHQARGDRQGRPRQPQ